MFRKIINQNIKLNKKKSRPKRKFKELVGIEPETPGMVSQNHTPRPPPLVKKQVAESQQMQLLPGINAFQG